MIPAILRTRLVYVHAVDGTTTADPTSIHWLGLPAIGHGTNIAADHSIGSITPHDHPRR